MATVTRKTQSDDYVDKLKSILDEYEQAYPGLKAEVYRYNPASIRIRVVGDLYAGMPKSSRHDHAYDFISQRSESDLLDEISMLLLLPESEKKNNFTSHEFDDPSKSLL